MTIKDVPVLFFIALLMTIQFPFHIAAIYFVPVLIISDYFKKKIKKGVDKDDKYCIMKARSVN